MTEAAKRYRVIQWATGNVGGESLKAILAHPRLTLAGVRVFSDDKVGVDAGELCGMPPTGVVATADTAALLATEADCVAYMPRHADLDEVCALLRSGKNVICTPLLPLASFERSHVPIAEHVHAADIATAMQAVNTIPALCEAAAGLRSSFELGLSFSGIGFRG